MFSRFPMRALSGAPGAIMRMNTTTSSSIVPCIGLPAVHSRPFSITHRLNLIYQPPTKDTPSKDDKPKQATKKLTASEMEDQEKEKRLAKNKYYAGTPSILKPYMKEIMLRPVGFGVSVVILHQFAVVVPFLFLWYYYMKFGNVPTDLPADTVAKGLDIIKGGLINLQVDDATKDQMASTGAAAYAVVKGLSYLRMPLCIAVAPWFDQWCIRPIGRLFRSAKKPTVVKPRSPQIK